MVVNHDLFICNETVKFITINTMMLVFFGLLGSFFGLLFDLLLVYGFFGVILGGLLLNGFIKFSFAEKDRTFLVCLLRQLLKGVVTVDEHTAHLPFPPLILLLLLTFPALHISAHCRSLLTLVLNR